MSADLAIRTSADQFRTAGEIGLASIPGVSVTRTWLRFDSPEAFAAARTIIAGAESAKPVALASLRRKAAELDPEPHPDPEPQPVEGVRSPERGQEFTIRGEGRFRADRLTDGGSSVTCWGPLRRDGKPTRASWRTFRLDRINTIHRGRWAS